MKNTFSTYFEQEILSASPLRLVCILYQAAIGELREARRHLAAGQVMPRCAAITQTCDIVGELYSSLNLNEGGEPAKQLQALYGYMISRLMQGNLTKNDEPFAEVLALLTTLHEGWIEAAASDQKSRTFNTPLPSAFIGHASQERGAQSWSF